MAAKSRPTKGRKTSRKSSSRSLSRPLPRQHQYLKQLQAHVAGHKKGYALGLATALGVGGAGAYAYRRGFVPYTRPRQWKRNYGVVPANYKVPTWSANAQAAYKARMNATPSDWYK